MIATPDPERIKAICKRRRQWYMATCIIGPLAVVAYFQQISSGAHGRLPPFAWAALLVSVAAVVLGDLIWRCPACKARLPRGIAPTPHFCPQCAIPLANPSERTWAGSKGARRFGWVLIGAYAIILLAGSILLPSRRHRHYVAGGRGAAPVFTQPNADDVTHLRRQLGEVDRLLAARYAGAALHASSADLSLLQRLVDECRRKPDQTLELQCLGVAFGNVLAREAEMHWIMVTDEYGRGPALQYESSSLIVFPLTMISKRVDAGEPVDLTRLLAAMRALVKQHAREADPASRTL